MKLGLFSLSRIVVSASLLTPVAAASQVPYFCPSSFNFNELYPATAPAPDNREFLFPFLVGYFSPKVISNVLWDFTQGTYSFGSSITDLSGQAKLHQPKLNAHCTGTYLMGPLGPFTLIEVIQDGPPTSTALEVLKETEEDLGLCEDPEYCQGGGGGGGSGGSGGSGGTQTLWRICEYIDYYDSYTGEWLGRDDLGCYYEWR